MGVGGGEGKTLFQKGAKGRMKYSLEGKVLEGEMIVGRKTVQWGGELLGIGGKVEKAAGSKHVLQVHREKYDRYHTLVTFKFLRSIYRKSPKTTRLTMRRHLGTRPRRHRILAPPQTRHRLRLRVKIDSGFAVERVSSTAGNGFFVAGEGEHW